MSILQFIFRDGWHFIGSVVILAILSTWQPFAIDKSVDNSVDNSTRNE